MNAPEINWSAYLEAVRSYENVTQKDSFKKIAESLQRLSLTFDDSYFVRRIRERGHIYFIEDADTSTEADVNFLVSSGFLEQRFKNRRMGKKGWGSEFELNGLPNFDNLWLVADFHEAMRAELQEQHSVEAKVDKIDESVKMIDHGILETMLPQPADNELDLLEKSGEMTSLLARVEEIGLLLSQSRRRMPGSSDGLKKLGRKLRQCIEDVENISPGFLEAISDSSKVDAALNNLERSGYVKDAFNSLERAYNEIRKGLHL